MVHRPASPHAGKKKLSFFEVVTALAFDHFAKSRIDIGIIEVGLGGRLDATNVLLTPLLTVCTDISFDHVEILGHTLRKIAIEKAGIIKPGVPHLIGFLPPEATRVMARTCRQHHAPLIEIDRNRFRFDEGRMRLDYTAPGLSVKNLEPSLVGVHQLKNAALVLQAVSELRDRGLAIGKQAVTGGLKSTHWPGRFQIIRRAGRPTVILDVGHNAAGVRAFVDSFHKRFPSRRVPFIVGFVRKKEHDRMVAALAEIASEFRLVPMKTHRSVDLRELISGLDWHGLPAQRYPSLKSAYERLVAEGGPDDIIVVIGSHYLVGEYLMTYGN